jgi:ABC-type branched-subunit amino acid transport system substrate-binding protein
MSKRSLRGKTSRRRHVTMAIAGMSAALVLSSCATTLTQGVDVHNLLRHVGKGGGGLALGTTSTTTSTTAPTAAAGAGATTAAARTATGATAYATPLIPADAPGVTNTTITIGVNLPNPQSAAEITAAFGANGVQSTDNLAAVEAIINYINAHGGVAGRKLVAVYTYTDITQGTYDSEDQAVCDTFTQDNKVFAVIELINDGSPVLASCLAQAGVVLIDDGNSIIYDTKTIEADFGAGYYEPTHMVLDRYGEVIDGLAQQGYFDGHPKIGVIIFDLPQYEETLTNVIEPALAKLGLSVTDTYAFAAPSSTAGVADDAAEASNAILRFKSEGIDHVLFVDSLSALPFLFMPVASSQGYTPRYGLSSDDIPEFLQQNAPASQLAGAVAVGYSEVRDIANPDYTGTPEMKECSEAVAPSGASTPAISYGMGCDPFFFLQAAVNSATEVSIAGMRAAVDRLGTSYQAADTPYTDWGPGNYDGVAAYRDLTFEGSCSCFEYTSGPIAFPSS